MDAGLYPSGHTSFFDKAVSHAAELPRSTHAKPLRIPPLISGMNTADIDSAHGRYGCHIGDFPYGFINGSPACYMSHREKVKCRSMANTPHDLY
jgi:hypothetical protein